MSFYNKKNALTLVEVLITLVIIGVISAFVIPSLILHIDRNIYKSAFKKEYTSFITAFEKVAMENGGSIKGLSNNSIEFRNLLVREMVVIKSCNQGYSEGCRYAGAKGQNGQDDTGLSWAENSPAVVLSDGAILQFYLSSADCSDSVHGCGFVIIDVNGMSPPNRAGEDVYMLHVRDNAVKPFGSSGDGYVDDCDNAFSMGWTCAFERLTN